MLARDTVVADKWRLERLLGEGGMSEVWLVRHVELDSTAALKVLIFRRSRLEERLLLEGRIQANLKHPHIVPVQDVLRHDGMVGLLMEFVDGETLGALLQRDKRLSLDQALTLFAPVMGAVASAHAAGVLHRDIKPGNILLARTSHGLVPKVTDFGIAKLIEGSADMRSTRAGAMLGTPGYLAPEQATDATDVDARADVFALGAMLYETLAGQPAFGNDGADALAYDAPARLDMVAPDVPADVVRAVHRAMDPDRARRFPDVASFAEALLAGHPELLAVSRGQRTALPVPLLERPVQPGRATLVAADAHPTPARPTTPVEPTLAEPAPASRWPWALALIAALGLAGVGAWWWRPAPAPYAPTPRVTVDAEVQTPPVAAPEPPAAQAPEAPATEAPDEAPEAGVDAGVAEDATEDRTPAPPEPSRTPPTAAPAPSQPAASASANTPAPEPEPVDERAPEPEPGAEDDAVAIVAPPVTRPPEPKAEPKPEPPPPVADIRGLWRGDASGRPVRIRVTSQDRTEVQADVTFILGAVERGHTCTGTLSPDGNLKLRAPDGSFALTATVSVPNLTGTYEVAGSKRPQPLQATWTSR